MRFTTTVPGLTMFPGMGGEPPWAAELTSSQIHEIVERCDAVGIDAIVIPWHLAIQRGEWERNMGARWSHSIAAAGYLLGASKRLEVMALSVAPCHHPIELAKGYATLDWMSGGRSTPVILSGYMDWEFEVMGADFAQRDAITDEYSAAMIELWEADEPRYEGSHVSFSDIAFEPRPRRRPMPVWFGGRSKASLRRIARHGDGWMSYATPHSQLNDAIAYIQDQPSFQERPRPVDVFAYFVESTHDRISHREEAPPVPPRGDTAIIEQLHHLAGCGVSTTTAPLMAWDRNDATSSGSFEEHLERLDWLGESIIPAARAIVPEHHKESRR